jgi:hypothetical protein
MSILEAREGGKDIISNLQRIFIEFSTYTDLGKG